MLCMVTSNLAMHNTKRMHIGKLKFDLPSVHLNTSEEAIPGESD